MKRSSRRTDVAGMFTFAALSAGTFAALSAGAAIAVAACSTTTQQLPEPVRPRSADELVLTPAAQAKADSGRPAYTRADVQFMQGMIHHHAQAIIMARWAPTHGARQDVKVLAARIGVGQADEIALMQPWLSERREMVPDPLAHHDMPGHQMSGMAMSDSLMPGMLTAVQMSQLERAEGPEFDRLFLSFMIQHHEGALTMAQRLFSSPGAGQDTFVWKFASEVEADQSTEIERMQSMLNTLSEGRRP